MTRTKACVDNNQPIIVEILRRRGFQVVHMHAVGKGFPDLIANKHGQTFLIEIKDGFKATYTKTQKEFYSKWLGSKIYTLRTEEEALNFQK